MSMVCGILALNCESHLVLKLALDSRILALVLVSRVQASALKGPGLGLGLGLESPGLGLEGPGLGLVLWILALITTLVYIMILVLLAPKCNQLTKMLTKRV